MFDSREKAVAYIKEWNRQFNGGKHQSEPSVVEGIEFWVVGRNASHEFYAGVGSDGRLYHRSFGETDYNRKTGEISYGEDVREVKDFSGYYGHF